MDILTETKSSAARFLAEHETMQEELANARLRLDDQQKEIDKLDLALSMQKDALAQANTDKNTYLQYSFELSAQLQFIVAGSARALLIASNVRNRIAQQASEIPPVAGADVAELEDIIHRIGEQNAKANDGNGITSTVVVNLTPGAVLNTDQLKPPPLPDGVLVDRDGKPMPSDATKSMQLAS